jgi:hypothetical protein
MVIAHPKHVMAGPASRRMRFDEEDCDHRPCNSLRSSCAGKAAKLAQAAYTCLRYPRIHPLKIAYWMMDCDQSRMFPTLVIFNAPKSGTPDFGVEARQ